MPIQTKFDITNTDAREWAKYFVEHIKADPSIAIDQDTMTTWFASAICAGVDWERRRIEKARTV